MVMICGQKAPSAKRCIKTCEMNELLDVGGVVRKHRAPKGALRPGAVGARAAHHGWSESTERQKVH